MLALPHALRSICAGFYAFGIARFVSEKQKSLRLRGLLSHRETGGLCRLATPVNGKAANRCRQILKDRGASGQEKTGPR
jgi:hypothetical protein